MPKNYIFDFIVAMMGEFESSFQNAPLTTPWGEDRINLRICLCSAFFWKSKNSPEFLRVKIYNNFLAQFGSWRFLINFRGGRSKKRIFLELEHALNVFCNIFWVWGEFWNFWIMLILLYSISAVTNLLKNLKRRKKRGEKIPIGMS